MPRQPYPKSRGRGAPPMLTPAQQKVVFEELDRGRTYEQIRADLVELGLDVAVSTLKKYQAQRRAAQRKANPPDPDEDAEVVDRLRERQAARADAAALPTANDDPPDDGAGVLELVRRQYRHALNAANKAQAIGDTVVAARHSKLATDALNTLARLEKSAAENKDAIIITPAELAQAELKLKDKLRAVLERPLLCAHCSHALSVDWGGGNEAEAAE